MDRRLLISAVAAGAVAAGGTVVAWNWPAAPAPRVAAAPAAAVVTAGPATAEPVVASSAPAGPEPVTTTKAAPKAAPTTRAASRNIEIEPAGDGRSAAVPQQSTPRFRMVSVTWADPAAAPQGEVQVRTRAARTGKWSAWTTLETAESKGPDTPAERTSRVRGGTGAIWVGDADAVTARLRGGSGTQALPAGLKLHLIDPGPDPKAPRVGTSGGQGGMADPDPGLAGAALLGPYRSRSSWGSDERLVRGVVQYAPSIKVQFVHHTAGGNTYDCADSAAIVRGIQYDHVQNRGWDDIGYNMFVDRCGTLFEGRRGGVDKPVIGAHTYGFNTGSSGIAVLGDYTGAGVTPKVQRVLARVAAANLTRYGLDPNEGSSELVSGVPDGKYPMGMTVGFNRISGHRNGVNTDCPGDALYAQLPAIMRLSSTTDPFPPAG